MTLCATRRVAGWSIRHNVVPGTPEGGSIPSNPVRLRFRLPDAVAGAATVAVADPANFGNGNGNGIGIVSETETDPGTGTGIADRPPWFAHGTEGGEMDEHI